MLTKKLEHKNDLLSDPNERRGKVRELMAGWWGYFDCEWISTPFIMGTYHF
jgi:hypothetical protein